MRYNPFRATPRRTKLLRALPIVAAATATALILGGCSSGGGGGANGTPIKVGAICDKTGATPFPEACDAAAAYFNDLNKSGGIKGHPVQYTVLDGAGSAATSSAAGSRLLNQLGVQALVGGASFNGCTPLLQQLKAKGVYSIEGFGVDSGCWSSPNITPLNTGGNLGYLSVLHYLFDVAGKKDVCAMVPNVPTLEASKKILSFYEDKSGHKIKEILLWNPGGDLTPMVAQAKSAGCDGVVLIGVDPVYVATLQTAADQGAFTAAESAVFSTGYTATLPKSLGSIGEGLVASSEFVPWSGDSAALEKFKALQSKAGFALSTLSEGGYLAAKLFVDAVGGIKGDINTQSIGAALKGLKNADTGGLTADPFTWGSLNVGAQFVQIKNGNWVPISDNKFYVPELTPEEAHKIATGTL